MNVKTEWLRHLGLSNVRFPREVAFPVDGPVKFTRQLVYSPTEYVELIDRISPSRNVYTSLYTTTQIRDSIVDKVYNDVDSDDFYHSCVQFGEISKVAYRRYGKYPRSYVTGCKGFAVYFDFDDTDLDARAVREWSLQLEKEAGVTLDHSVMETRMRRVSRIPYTYNFNALAKYGQVGFCVPVNPKWTCHEIAREASKPSRMLEVSIEAFPEVASEIREIANNLPREELPVRPFVADATRQGETLGRMMEVARNVRDGREKIVSFVILPSLVAMGATVEECRTYVRTWLDATPKSYNWQFYDRHVELRYEKIVAENRPPWRFETLLLKYPEIAQTMVS